MPRTKPIQTIDIIGSLEINPERAIGDYLQSQKQEKYEVKHPNWDSAGESVELLLIRNRREHEAMVRQQKEMLEGERRQATVNIHRTKRIIMIQNNLRKRFIQVNGFIKECDDKRRVADRKVADEKEKHRKIRSDIKQCKLFLRKLSRFRESLRKTVEAYRPYEEIMTKVVEASDIFESVKDCTDRCDALMLAQVDISDLATKKLLEIEEMRRRMITITNEAALTVLGLRTDLAELERSYNSARNECLRWEKKLSNAKDTAARVDLNKALCLDAIHQIYRLLCHRRQHAPSFTRLQVESLMDYIKNEVEIIRAVLRECSKQDHNNVKTVQGYAAKESTKC